jgi:hypothetical protein
MSDRRGAGRGGWRDLLPVVVASAVASASSMPAVASELPKRKAGLWEVKTTGGPMGARTIQQCIDAKTDDLLGQQGNPGQQCSQPVITRNGSRYAVKVTCDSGSVKTTLDGNYVMAQDTAYTGDMKMTFTPPQAGMSGMDMKMDGKWLGACKQGMKPGDVVMQGMPNFNVLEPGKDGSGMNAEQMRRMLEDIKKNLPKQQPGQPAQ